MSINVKCPNGCSIQLSKNSIGKIADCPNCKSTIRVPRKSSGKEFVALLIADPGDLEESNTEQSTEFSASELIAAPKRTVRSNPNSKPDAENPFEFLSNKENVAAVDISAGLPIEVEKTAEAGLVEIEMEEKGRIDVVKDRVWLSRFYAFCLLFVGLVNALPVIVFAIYFRDELGSMPLPRWAFCLIFAAMIFIAYSIYLMQLADWSALLMVTLFTLLAACFYGFFAAGLLLGDANGVTSRFLQLPQAYYRFGPIWSGILFGVCALASFVFGLDAFSWYFNNRSRKLNSAFHQ